MTVAKEPVQRTKAVEPTSSTILTKRWRITRQPWTRKRKRSSCIICESIDKYDLRFIRLTCPQVGKKRRYEQSRQGATEHRIRRGSGGRGGSRTQRDARYLRFLLSFVKRLGNSLFVLCSSSMTITCCLIYLDDGADHEVSARPRRMSEFNMATKTEPIPAGSSFFLFSQTNRYQ